MIDRRSCCHFSRRGETPADARNAISSFGCAGAWPIGMELVFGW
jgi:hypothetical protein